jgi:hypothetical protein
MTTPTMTKKAVVASARHSLRVLIAFSLTAELTDAGESVMLEWKTDAARPRSVQ